MLVIYLFGSIIPELISAKDTNEVVLGFMTAVIVVPLCITIGIIIVVKLLTNKNKKAAIEACQKPEKRSN
jgi:hypothetical protein